MRGNWKRNLVVFAVFAAGIVQVTDVYAIWPLRRRANYRNDSGYSQSYGTNYGTAGTYATTPSMPNATVTAPGVGVSTGPGGAGVSVPGVGVNAGVNGANVVAPGADINATAGRNAPGAGIQVRGQTPDGSAPR